MARSAHEVKMCPVRHREKKTYECQDCGKICASRYGLQTHRLSAHVPDSEKPFKCSHCDKGFAKKDTLRTHMNTHTNARPYACRHECGEAFNNAATRNQHEARVHGETKGFKINRAKKPVMEK